MIEIREDSYISLDDAAKYLNIKSVTLRKCIKQKGDFFDSLNGKVVKSLSAPSLIHGCIAKKVQ